MRSARIAAVGVAALFTTFGGLLAGAGAAQAAPTGCSSYPYGPTGGEALCTGGTGLYRVNLKCKATAGGYFYFKTGTTWVTPGTPSNDICDPGDSRQSVGILF